MTYHMDAGGAAIARALAVALLAFPLAVPAARAQSPTPSEVRVFPDASRSSPATSLLIDTDDQQATVHLRDGGRTLTFAPEGRRQLARGLDSAAEACAKALRRGTQGMTAVGTAAANEGGLAEIGIEALGLHCRVRVSLRWADGSAAPTLHLNLAGAERLARAAELQPQPAPPPVQIH